MGLFNIYGNIIGLDFILQKFKPKFNNYYLNRKSFIVFYPE